jgi:hypothetical protein
MKFTNLGFPAVERRLTACDDTVQRAFQILHAAILYMDDRIQVKEYAKAEGLGYEIDGRPFCRMDPKRDYIGVGLSNNVRNAIKATGRLRVGRLDRAWFNHDHEESLAQTLGLIEAAFRQP